MMSIHIIDDSKVIRDRLSEKLMERIRSLRTMTAETSEEARENIIGCSPDVVIVDIRLKEGSGFDVLKFLQGIKTRPVIIVLTNYAIEPYRNKALRLGADYFLDKSQEFDRAVAIIEECARRLERERQPE